MGIIKSKCCHESADVFIEKKYYCTKCYHQCKTYNDSFLVSLMIFSVLAIILGLILISSSLNDYKFIKHNKIEHFEDVQLNDSAITAKLVELGCILPNVALAQIKIESANYTSNLTKRNKNLLGIRKGDKYRVYNTYTECLQHYIKIQNRYLQAIDGKYAEDSNYIYKLKNMK